MTEVISGELPSLPERAAAPANLRQVLPAVELRELVEHIEHVLTDQQARGADVARQAVFVAHYLAPRIAEQRNDLVDARVQLQQTAAAVSALVAELNRVDELAVRRANVNHRLRAELASRDHRGGAS